MGFANIPDIVYNRWQVRLGSALDPAVILEIDQLQNPSSARMAGAGTAYKLIGSFLKLKKGFPKLS